MYNTILVPIDISEDSLTHMVIPFVQAHTAWICPYISRHLLSLNPLLARCRRYSRGER
ncbi:hypothetical protein [Enterobacter roggenkampii]|uniref:hypothetical protein n=1 Tax=Enterobacter roggenkampii TaxID=1812935 RepID=UPI003D6F0A53